MIERRKDTAVRGVKLPRDYLDMVEKIFNKNFESNLIKENKEVFVAFGEMYPDEVILVVSLKYPDSIFMTTCYASVDYPIKPLEKATKSKNVAEKNLKQNDKAQQTEPETEPESESKKIETAVHICVDAIASFFNTFFQKGPPLDYDTEYRQNWTQIELDNKQPVHMRINRDNLELDAQATEIIEKDDAMKEKAKKPVH